MRDTEKLAQLCNLAAVCLKDEDNKLLPESFFNSLQDILVVSAEELQRLHTLVEEFERFYGE